MNVLVPLTYPWLFDKFIDDFIGVNDLLGDEDDDVDEEEHDYDGNQMTVLNHLKDNKINIMKTMHEESLLSMKSMECLIKSN